MLLHLGFNGAPVVDPLTYNLVGIITAFDVLAKEEGGTLLHLVQDGSTQNVCQVADVARKICAKTVEDLMTPRPLTITPTTTMKVAAEIMTRDRCHRLCVVDDKGSLVGVLATADVMRHVLNIAHPSLPEGADSLSKEEGLLSP